MCVTEPEVALSHSLLFSGLVMRSFNSISTYTECIIIFIPPGNLHSFEERKIFLGELLDILFQSLIDSSSDSLTFEIKEDFFFSLLFSLREKTRKDDGIVPINSFNKTADDDSFH